VAADPISSPRRRLPVVTLYVTERCNSRCVTCDYWRNGQLEMGVPAVRALLADLERLETQVVVLSGGEPLVHREWPALAELLRSHGLEVWLLTAGLALAKHAASAARLFASITVSLDGANAATYAAIRGVDAFDKVCEGIRASVAQGRAPALRVTLQRGNFRELRRFVGLAKTLGAARISFLAVDIANSDAFGRSAAGAPHPSAAPALESREIIELEEEIRLLELEHAEDFRSGFIAESPPKLRRIAQYFAALHGASAYPKVRCNAPEFSAVVAAGGSVRPCFFIAGPSGARAFEWRPREEPVAHLARALESEPMAALRAEIRDGARAECKRCVCAMWREPGSSPRMNVGAHA
jgi:MoaA/NifB/PqqE/SkfB family radical SAM enzyme